MSEIKTNICPCCSKGCDLSAPRCSRGEEYLRTGIIPERGSHDHPHEDRQPREERKAREDRRVREEHPHHEEHRHPSYEEMGIDGKLQDLLSRLGRAGHGASDGKSSQTRILHILSKTDSMTQRELTEQLGIRPGSASEIIKKLETAGLITRQSNSEDRRTVDIALTDAGKAQAEASNARHAGHAPFDVLSDEEKQQLLALLEKLGRDWNSRFRGEGRGDHRHGEKKGRRNGHGDPDGQDSGRGHKGQHRHDAEKGHAQKHDRGHKGDHAHDSDHGRDRRHSQDRHEDA